MDLGQPLAEREGGESDRDQGLDARVADEVADLVHAGPLAVGERGHADLLHRVVVADADDRDAARVEGDGIDDTDRDLGVAVPVEVAIPPEIDEEHPLARGVAPIGSVDPEGRAVGRDDANGRGSVRGAPGAERDVRRARDPLGDDEAGAPEALGDRVRFGPGLDARVQVVERIERERRRMMAADHHEGEHEQGAGPTGAHPETLPIRGGERERIDTLGAGEPERVDRRLERGSGRADVVDEEDPASVEPPDRPERAAQLAEPRGSVATHLVPRVAHALERAHLELDAQHARDRRGEEAGLVEAAGPVPRGMERHRHDEVDAVEERVEGGLEEGAEDLRMLRPALVLEPPDGVRDRSSEIVEGVGLGAPLEQGLADLAEAGAVPDGPIAARASTGGDELEESSCDFGEMLHGSVSSAHLPHGCVPAPRVGRKRPSHATSP